MALLLTSRYLFVMMTEWIKIRLCKILPKLLCSSTGTKPWKYYFHTTAYRKKARTALV